MILKNFIPLTSALADQHLKPVPGSFLSARFYDYENWRIVDAIQDKIENGLLQLFCVDSIDSKSFYANTHPSKRINKHLQYEKHILNEVVPFIKNKKTDQSLVAAGCSLGGYHAVNIA
jgi:esterase/lipase superfamily enzyme